MGTRSTDYSLPLTAHSTAKNPPQKLSFIFLLDDSVVSLAGVPRVPVFGTRVLGLFFSSLGINGLTYRSDILSTISMSTIFSQGSPGAPTSDRHCRQCR